MMKKQLLRTMLLLFALVAGSSSVWGETKPWSGDDPESTLDLQTITSSTMGTWNGAKSWYLDDDYLVVSGYESYKSVANQTWITQASVGSSGSSWDASDPFQGSSYYTTANYATIQAGRYILYKVTNMKSLKVYGKNNATTKYLDIFIYTKSGDDYTKVEEIKYTTDKNVHIWENSENLDTDETYFIYITGVGNSNSQVYEVAFERNSIVDTRANAGLAYAAASQTVAVGNILAAPALTNPNGLAVNYESGDESIATVDEDGNVTGVAKGITTITASFAGDATYKPGNASYTITVTKVMASNSIMYESFDTNDQTGGNDGTWGGISTTPAAASDLTGWTFTTAYGASQCVRTGKGGSITSPALGVAGDVTLKFKMGSWSGDTNNGYVDILNGGTFEGGSDTQKTVSIDKGAWKEFTLNINGVTAATKIKFSDNGNNKRLFIDEVEILINTQTVSISEAGYATFAAPYAVDFSATSLEVYTAQVNGAKNGVVLNEVASKKVPANTAVILKGETAEGAVIATADALADNDLVAGPVTGDGVSYYALGKEGEKVGFGILADGTELPANKAYIPASKFGASAPAFMPFDFGGTTDISEKVIVKSEKFATAPVYNLAGQRVMNPSKGLFIMNGKKVAIK